MLRDRHDWEIPHLFPLFVLDMQKYMQKEQIPKGMLI